MSYSFRIHIKLPKNKGLNCNYNEFEIISDSISKPIKVKSANGENRIVDSEKLFFVCDGIPELDQAILEGKQVLNSIIWCFIASGFGIDFGTDASNFEIPSEKLVKLQQLLNYDRIHQDKLGLMVYESSPTPRFAQFEADLKKLDPVDNFINTFIKCFENQRDIGNDDLLSIKLYNSSFFEEIPESRFLLLVMSIEAIINCDKRADEVLNHVDKMIYMTNKNHNLSDGDKKSIIGSLGYLKNQSIGQAGRQLAKKRLGENKYDDLSPVKFFDRVYSIRSKLVHGNSTPPSSYNLNKLSNELEKFVSDLLTA